MSEQEAGPPVTAITTVSAPDCRCIAFCADGSALAVVAGGRLTCYEYPDRAIWSVDCAPAAGLAVDVAWGAGPESLYLLSDGRLSSHEAESGSLLGLPEQIGAAGSLSAVEVSPDGHFVAAGTAAGPVLVVDDRTQDLLELPGLGPVTALGWRPDGAELCVARDGSVEFWDVSDQAMLGSLAVPSRHATRLAWSPDASLLAVVTRSDVHAITPGASGGWTISGQWTGEGEPVAARFSRDGRKLLIGIRGGNLTIADRDLRSSGVIPAEVIFPGTLDVSSSGVLALRVSATRIGLFQLPDTAAGSGRTSASDRRWAARHGRTVGRRTPAISGRGVTPGRPELLATTGSIAPAFAWWPDGRTACLETDPGKLVRVRPPGSEPIWQWSCPAREISHVAISHEGIVAIIHHNEVAVLDSDGAQINRLNGAGEAAWSPPSASPEPLLAVLEPGLSQVLLYRPRTANRPPQRLAMPSGVAGVAWSPEGQLLAAAGRGHVVVWDMQTLQQARQPLAAGMEGRLTGPLAWSPDGRHLAAVVRGAEILIWNTRNWQLVQRIPVPARQFGPPLAWSPDGRTLAFPGAEATGDHVEVWDIVTQHQLAALHRQGQGRVAGLFWSPAGDKLTVTHNDGLAILWDIVGSAASAGEIAPGLPFGREILVKLARAATAAGASVPLSLLCGLLALLGGNPPEDLQALAAHRGAALLRGLQWPLAARIGLVTLLAVDLPRQAAYAAPPNVTQDELSMALRQVLAAPACEAIGPPVPVVELTVLLDRVAQDARLLTLLELIGPGAVAADPGLPARLRHVRDELSPLTTEQRKLLGIRASLSRQGRSEAGTGAPGQAGLARHGKVGALLPSQLALPALFTIRYSRDELLYRTRTSSPPRVHRATVLVLDDTAAAHGQVGVILRMIAHLLATAIIGKGRRCALVTLGQPGSGTMLSRPEDLIRIWTAGTDAPPDIDASLRLAEGLLAKLATVPGRDARVILLTHPYQATLPYPGSISVRVHYPGRPMATGDPLSIMISPEPTAAELTTAIASLAG